MKISLHFEQWPTVTPFRIAGRVYEKFESLNVEISDGTNVGRGEAHGVHYLGETPSSMMAQIEAIYADVMKGIDRTDLARLLPPGGARNALDSALWDLEAKRAGRTIWELTEVVAKPLETVFTIGLESTADKMAEKADAARAYGLLKVKLDGNLPVERIRAIRTARPDARIVVDVNQGWTFPQLRAVAPVMADLGVLMIEQPLPRGADHELENYRSPVRLCADESCLHLGELGEAASRYQMINIKLDKTGGLSHALELASEARARGLGIMVGCMGGTSLAVAPAFVIGCVSDLVDIDGPLLQKCDRVPGLLYEGGRVSVFGPDVWG